MRKRFEIQYELGTTAIEEVKIPERSRDELPPVIRALQHIYSNPRLNEQIFDIIEERVKVVKMGKPGMSLWEILVLGVVRLTLDINYDRLEHVANYDSLVRDMLGLRSYGMQKKKRYSLTSLKENIRYIDEGLMERINEIVVKEGHRLKKKDGEVIRAKVDSYVLESNVHFPTDINLLWDSARKSLDMIEKIMNDKMIEGWRKLKSWRRRMKNSSRKIGMISKGGGKNKRERMKEEVKEYLKDARLISNKIKGSKEELLKIIEPGVGLIYMEGLKYYEDMLDKHIDMLERRVIKEEEIPHEEKVFSIFEPYTEWIQKGKSFNRVELGLKLAICTDQHEFILHHQIMEKQQDVDVAIPISHLLKEKYFIESISFDKGYWSKINYERISKQIKKTIIPKKGKRNQEESEREGEESFKKLRRQHSSIESDINSLEHHGLNRCPDRGIKNFRKYVALGVLAYNLHKLGNVLKQEDVKKKLKPAA